MTCSARVSVSKVYDEKRKEYVVKKEVTVDVNNGYLGIEPMQLKKLGLMKQEDIILE